MKRRNGEKGQGKKKKDMMFFTFPFSLIRFVFLRNILQVNDGGKFAGPSPRPGSIYNLQRRKEMK